jgi:hypothetical protein
MCSAAGIWVTSRAWRMAGHSVIEAGSRQRSGRGSSHGWHGGHGGFLGDVRCFGDLGHRPRMAMASHKVREPGGNNGAGGGARTEGTEDTEVF